LYCSGLPERLELMRVPVLNGSEAISRAKHKLACLQELASRNLPVPDTLIARYPRDLDRLMKLLGGPPVILKLLRGTQGTGVIFAESRQSVESVLETVWSLGEDILLQRFIAESKGRDLRALVLDGKVAAAMRRVGPPGEFRSNIHRGGAGTVIQLPEAYEQAAVRAAQLIGLEIAGVDMLESKDGPKIMEINSSPGFEGLERATGLDVAGAIVDHALSFAERQRARPLQRGLA
jgi:ribosomal protein S6--L-glutamate ligase